MYCDCYYDFQLAFIVAVRLYISINRKCVGFE